MKFEVWNIGPKHAWERDLKSGESLEICNKGERDPIFAINFHKKRLFCRQRVDVVIHPRRVSRYNFGSWSKGDLE